MKNLIVTSILAISFITASATQLLESNMLNDTITKKEVTATEVYPILVAEEEADEPFEFNTKDYLPVGFNASLTLDENYNLEFAATIEEADEPFEFNTKDYLPIGFNLNREILNNIVEIINEEQDAPFEFDTKKYLPKGFNPTKEQKTSNEL